MRLARSARRSHGSRVVVIAVLAMACRPVAPTTPPVDQTTTPAPTPVVAPTVSHADRFAELEARLLTGKEFEIVFAIESHGAIETKLRGIVRMGAGRALLEADGTFAGVVGTTRIECDGTNLRGAGPAGRVEMPCPGGLQPALMLGMMRMGLLHNVAMAWAGRPPDRSELAGIRAISAMDAWVTTQGHRAPPKGGDGIAFDIAVEGTVIGDASLVLDGRGLPSLREQTVRFDGGEMRVIEQYETFTLDGG